MRFSDIELAAELYVQSILCIPYTDSGESIARADLGTMQRFALTVFYGTGREPMAIAARSPGIFQKEWSRIWACHIFLKGNAWKWKEAGQLI